MRLLVVVLLIAAAAGGYWWMRIHHAPAAAASSGPFGGGDTAAVGPAAPAPESPAPSAPAAVPPEAATAIAKADAMWDADKGDCTAADAPQMARLYSQALRALYAKPGLSARAATLISDRLAPLGHDLFFTKTRYGEDASGLMGSAVAAPGDAVNKIARRFGMSQQFLNRLRGSVDANDGRLQVGDTLKVVAVKDHGGFFIHICKSEFTLDCFIGGVFAKRYPISEGTKETPTPVGKTHLVDRCWHPDWTHPKTHEVIHYGDPANILGPIWLPFNGEELGQNGIGIHGYTGEGAGPGKMASSGCIRLINDDAIELYSTLSQPELTPTAVEIVE